MQTALIRPLAEGDHDTWLELWRGYQAFYKVDLPQEVNQATWTRLLDPREPMHGAVAVLGGAPVGLAHWIFHRSSWTVGNYCYLQDLFVSLEARGAGLGRQLIEHVYAAARRAGCPRVYWLTHESNLDAMKLYDRIGERSGFVHYRKALG